MYLPFKSHSCLDVHNISIEQAFKNTLIVLVQIDTKSMLFSDQYKALYLASFQAVYYEYLPELILIGNRLTVN